MAEGKACSLEQYPQHFEDGILWLIPGLSRIGAVGRLLQRTISFTSSLGMYYLQLNIMKQAALL